MAALRGHAQTSFTRIITGPVATDLEESVGCAWVDYDDDGFLDLFVTNFGNSATNTLYHNNRDGTFSRVTAGPLVTEGGTLSPHGCAWGDYDNDGFPDLFVANLKTNNWLYRNNGNGVFERVTTGSIVNDFGMFNTCAWVDYDNDGYLDLFVTNEGLRNRLYHNNGDGTFVSVTQGNIVNDIANNSTGCSWGDYDNDGFLDLFVANGGVTAKQNNFLYHNNGNSNHWIKVRCVGTVSNRSAIGAIVRARALINGAVRWQMRQISGGDGWLCQNSLDVSIGFGNAINIDLLRIEWPSGIIQELQDVAFNQTLIVEEPPRIQISALAGGGFEVSLKGGGRDAFGRQRTYDIETSDDLVGWSMCTSVVVTNVDGTVRVQDSSPGYPARFYRARRSVSE